MARYENADIDKLKTQRKTGKLMRIFKKAEAWDTQSCAADALIELQDQRCVDPAIQILLYDNDYHRKTYACRMLGGLRAQSAVPSLVWFLENGSREHGLLFGDVVDALENIGDKRAIPAIAKTNEVHAYLKYPALETLGWKPSIYLPFFSMKEKIDYYIFREQYDRICDMGAEAVSYLLPEMVTARYKGAADTLVKINSKDACEPLIEQWLKPNMPLVERENRKSVVYVLGELQCTAAIRPLVNILKNPHHYLHWSMIDDDLLDTAQKALAKFGQVVYEYVKELVDPETMRLIWYQLESNYISAQDAQEYAVKAICATKHPEVFDLFKNLIRSRDYQGKEVAAFGFEALGDKRAIEILKTARRVKNGRAGSAAEYALEALKKSETI